MKKRRWMETVLKEAKKPAPQVPWARKKRATNRATKAPQIQAAE